MEFSQVFSFLTILSESVNLLPKIWKTVAPITTISLILPSLFFLPVSYPVLLPMESSFIYLLLVPISRIPFFFVHPTVSHFSVISTIMVSAVAYTGNTVSLSDLMSAVGKTWRGQLKTSILVSLKPAFSILFLVVLICVLITFDLINLITVCLLIALWLVIMIFHLKSLEVRAVALVASVVEDDCKECKAMERGEELARGSRFKGFMMNLVMYISVCVCFVVFWITVGNKGSLNMMFYGYFYVNVMGLLDICSSVVYTVFYFQCRKYHGEEIGMVGKALYSKLTESAYVSVGFK